MAAPQDDRLAGATRSVTTATAALAEQPSSSASQPVRWALLAWWLLPLLYFGWLIHNALLQS
jgi:hypothetical protein